MTNNVTTAKNSPSIPDKRQMATAGQYLSFMLGNEIYALGILNIKEILEYGNLTEVPMMPDFVCGVINLRGNVVPIIDLQARFGNGATQIHKRSGIVIVETNDDSENGKKQDISIIVDAVNEVIDIGQQDIEPPPSFGTGIRPEFISGMAKRDDRFIILLNIDRILSIDEMADLSQSMEEQNQGQS